MSRQFACMQEGGGLRAKHGEGQGAATAQAALATCAPWRRRDRERNPPAAASGPQEPVSPHIPISCGGAGNRGDVAGADPGVTMASPLSEAMKLRRGDRLAVTTTFVEVNCFAHDLGRTLLVVPAIAKEVKLPRVGFPRCS